MSVRDRVVPGTELLSESRVDAGYAALATLLAVGLIAPLAWLVIDAAGLGSRAFEFLVADQTLAVLGRSVALVSVVTAAAVSVGVPLAVLTVQAALPFRRFWTVVIALPLAVPSYLGAFAALSAFGPDGPLSTALGVPLPAVEGFAGAAVVLTLYTYPYVFLTTRASLLSLDASLVEAARTLNCGQLESFRRITLPQIVPGIAAGALLVALYTLADFGTPNFMNLQVYTQFIYTRHNAHMGGYAALLSLQLLAVTGVILAVESAIGADDSGAYASRGNRGAAELDLGAWRYPALALPVLVAVAALVLPVGIFAMWLIRGGPGYEFTQLSFSWSYGWNSLKVSLLAAVASVLVALPIALRSVTTGSTASSLTARIPYVGYATPGIVLAIALVSFSLDAVPGLYKTVPLLVFAYVIRFMPQAIGSIRTSTMQVDDRLVEAARTLGRSRAGAFRTVTLPLIVPGIVTGAALVFLTSMKELPATLLLRPLGFDTLVTFIWRARETGLYGQAAVPAFVLVFVSGLSMAVLLAQEGDR
ncbi:iron ABC transporter permease [Halorubrum sp. BOL3-1]|uniref:ABC transporter permease n=1 Tax=Halorubrum sp. BOL3-1 TaxID=2497325 RepID=UPI001004F9AD|nr:iron ABC transporter permease [Halorubrum sp. BOL3-1]QAU13127.1 iron ABC transporter permease [Halorubrum sp. BOL3-1]